jgi:hypothetical protein
MSIDRADKIVAQLAELTREDYGALPPVERRRLIEALEEAHRIAKVEETVAEARDATTPKGGIVDRLNRGERSS